MSDPHSPAGPTDFRDQTLRRMIQIGLADPFIQAICCVVVVALAASFVISFLGDGLKAVLAIGLSIIFGVILVVLRVLIANTNGIFVKALCFIISGTIAAVFVLMVAFVVPAVTICWPAAYRDTLGLRPCATPAKLYAGPSSGEMAFTPKRYDGQGLVTNPDNGRYKLWVFYRPNRIDDAERIVGAFQTAGYWSDALESTLNEAAADDRSPGITLIKASTPNETLVPEITRIVRLAVPVGASRMRTMPGPGSFVRGDVQIDLF